LLVVAGHESTMGKFKDRSSPRKALKACANAAGAEGRFSGNGLRRTFNELARRASVDPIITRSMTGHLTEQMREHPLLESSLRFLMPTNPASRSDTARQSNL
jgi:hypothetical protein